MKHIAPAARHHVERRLIGGFERNGHAPVGLEKERHLHQGVADGEVLDLGPGTQFRFVGRERQRFVRRNAIGIVRDLAPDQTVDAVRVSRPRWKGIDDEEVDAAFQEFAGLSTKSRIALRLDLLPGETISMRARTRSPLTYRTTISLFFQVFFAGSAFCGMATENRQLLGSQPFA